MRVLITGITGQDGSYLAELLLTKGYEVHGIVRRVANPNKNNRFSRIAHLLNDVILHSGEVENYSRVFDIVTEVKPDECYHLAAQSFVTLSWCDAWGTLKTNINGTLNILTALKKQSPGCKFYFAASSEMFGKVRETPQTEETPFYPRSPYGISKVAGFDLTRNFRESYDMFACSGILFNHESPRRGEEFVTRKITDTVARIKMGLTSELRLGNLDAKRDWGFAGDYVEAMWLMLQQDEPDDFVIATGTTHSVRQFCDLAFSHVGLNYKDHVIVDKQFYRPADVEILKGNAGKAYNVLRWIPKTPFIELVKIMVEYDVKEITGNA